jgi:hypothetical protein
LLLKAVLVVSVLCLCEYSGVRATVTVSRTVALFAFIDPGNLKEEFKFMAKKLLTGVALVAILFSLATLSFGQGTESAVKGNLAGTVSDPSGAVIQGAKVTITGPTGEKAGDTDAEGKFLFQVLVPGYYSVRITKEGFKTTEIKSAEVVTGRTSVVTLKMELGTSSTTVEVNASSVEVDTTSTAIASNLTDTFYQSVPVGRGVTGLFYAAPGVASGGGTGTANPSIAGGTGLENNYIADGVSITDGAFGGIGVFSRLYGSLSTGINLSFVKEVQVKTGGFEAQYGKSTGGIVQIVTKSGSNQFHGTVGGFFAPQQMEMQRKTTDDFGLGTPDARFNLQGRILHQSNYDVDAEIGGPLLKDHLFFFGSFNPSWNTDYDRYAQFQNSSDLGTPVGGVLPGPSQTSLNKVQISNRVYSYAGKGTWRLNDHHQVEASLFGDPTYGDNSPNGPALNNATSTVNDKLQYGTRNFVARYNGTLSPTWLVNFSWSWGHNNLNDKPSVPNVYQIVDLAQRLPCGFVGSIPAPPCTSDPSVGAFAAGPSLSGQFTRQGLGYYENTKGDNYGYNVDTSKTFRFLGEHNLTFGYRYDVNHYDGTKSRTGPNIAISQSLANLFFDPADPLNAALVTNGTNAAFQMRIRVLGGGTASPSSCVGGPQQAEVYIAGIGGPNACPDGGIGVRLRMTRGEFGLLNFKTRSNYHTVFVQDNWSMNKYVSLSAGLRWEQQRVQGVNAAYTFNDNWSPRVGISVDPWGNRKSKVYANFGRYTEALPLDIAIRSLSAEYDFADSYWVPPTDGAGHVLIKSDGTMDLSTLEGARVVDGNVVNPADGYYLSTISGASAQSAVAFAPHARSEYLDEYVVGFEHEFSNSGVIFSARYTDRRMKRIIEDLAALSPEAADTGLTQQYLIGNPSKTTDYFTNPGQFNFTSDPNADWDPVLGYVGPTIPGCGASTLYALPTDSNGNTVTNSAGKNSTCITNEAVAGAPIPDGIADGFVNVSRVYKAVEFEVNKSMSKGWQLRANYRIAKLVGNYEGSFRNDNGQTDPNISSLFDFTQGDFNLLGQQFVPGVLNTDVRHLANGFVSYTFSGDHAKGLTMGSAVHFQTGIPINNLYAHPVYANAGEIPFCADNTTNCTSARGSLGRTSNWGSVDYHIDYPIRITEGTRLRLAADLFNITNNRTLLRNDQRQQITVGAPNVDFLKPLGVGPSGVTGNTNPGYQRPFYARFGVKFEF